MKELIRIKENKSWIIILLGILFLYNGIQILREDGIGVLYFHFYLICK